MPYSHVVNAVLAAAEAGLRVVIAVEGSQEARFTLADAVAEPRLAKFLATSQSAKNLSVMSNTWVSFHSDRELTVPASYGNCHGCSSILSSITITPEESVVGCCGLTMEYIPEMKLGRAGDDLRELFFRQYDDFLKIWLAVDGPEKVFRFAAERDPGIRPS